MSVAKNRLLSGLVARAFLPLALLSTLGCGDMAPAASENLGAQTSALTSYASKVLLITDRSVVRNAFRTSDPCTSVSGDEDKAWTIGHMLKREAEKSGLSPATYVTKWLDAWNSTATINGQTHTASAGIGPGVRQAWTAYGGESRLEKAPFVLLAIVNRIDLRTFRPLGEPLGGEIRFVFAPVHGQPDCSGTTEGSDIASIILEYSPAKADENAVLDWAKRWDALAAKTLDSLDYRAALATLTEELINSGKLLRIRTNEPTGSTWKLAEFEPDASTKYLVRSTIKQSPTEALHTQTSTALGGWIRDNATKLEAIRPRPRTDAARTPVAAYMVPDRFPGTSTYLRGSFNALDTNNGKNFWNATKPDNMVQSWEEARHLFSFNTCSGCHGRETDNHLFSFNTCSGCHGRETDTGFFHIKASPGQAAELSQFLKGPVSVIDPINPAKSRTFDEMGRREQDLAWLVAGGWVGVPVVRNEHAGGGLAANSYKVQFKNGLKCLDIQGSSQSQNALAIQYACHGGANQRLAIVDRGNSQYNLVFKHSGLCLDVENASLSNNARVVQKTCSGTTSQTLAMWLSGSQTGRHLRFEHSGKCLSVQNNSTADNAQVVQYTCDSVSSDTRAFIFVE